MRCYSRSVIAPEEPGECGDLPGTAKVGVEDKGRGSRAYFVIQEVELYKGLLPIKEEAKVSLKLENTDLT